MSTEQKQDINARIEKILADVSDAITGSLDAPDPISKTQVLSEGYAKILRLILQCEAVDGLHLPNPGEMPAHVEQMKVHDNDCGAEPREGSAKSIKDHSSFFKIKESSRVVHTTYLGVDMFLVVAPHVSANGEIGNGFMITEGCRVIFEGFSRLGMAKTWQMGKAAFRKYQLARFHNIRHRRNRAAVAAPVSAAPRGAEAAETLARPVLPEDDE